MPEKSRRNSLRLQGFDYATDGAYFITICCKDHFPFFGKIQDGKMKLSPIGEILQREWIATMEIWDNVYFDTWVYMPNHFHAIVVFGEFGTTDLPIYSHLPNTPGHQNRFVSPSKNLSSLVRGFKGALKRNAKKEGYLDFEWQRSFHDRIVRNKTELEAIRNYILNNPRN